METIDSFSILIQPSEELIEEGYGYIAFEINGIKFYNDSDYKLTALIDDLIYSFTKERNNYSDELFNLSKNNIVSLENCYDEIISLEDFPHLKKYNEEFNQKRGNIIIFLSHYTFDSYLVMYVRSIKGERLIFWDEDRNICEDAYFEHGGILKHLKKTELEIMENFNPKYIHKPIVTPFLEKSIEVNWRVSDHYDYIYDGKTDSKFFAEITPSRHIGFYMWLIFQDSGFNQWGGEASSVEDAKRAVSNWLVENMDTWVVSNSKNKEN